MTTLYKTIICPRCKEDYLFITMNNDTRQLYLRCSECMASWYSIENAKNNTDMFIDPNIDASDPTADEIKKYGWGEIVSGEVDVQQAQDG